MVRSHILTTVFFLASAALFFEACGSDVAEGGSNSNWLSPCETSADCGGSPCLCGLCTRSCTDTEDCGDDGGQCLAPDDPLAGGRCAGAEVAGVCLLTCVTEADCESIDTGLSCDHGVCIRGAATDEEQEGGDTTTSLADGGSSTPSSPPDASLTDPDGGSAVAPEASAVPDTGAVPVDGRDVSVGPTDDVQTIPETGSPSCCTLPGPDRGEPCAPGDPLLRPDSGEIAPDWCREPYVCVSGTCSDASLCSPGYEGECIVADPVADGNAMGDGGVATLGDIEADDDYVYWVKPSNVDGFRNYVDDGAIFRKPIFGGPTETIISDLRGPTELFLTPTHVFWLAAVNPAVSLSDTRIWRLALGADSGAAEIVFEGLSLTLNEHDTLTDGAHIYWSGSYAIRRVPVDGSGVEEVIATTSSPYGVDMTQDAQRIYWVGGDGISWVLKDADAGSGGVIPVSFDLWKIIKVPGAVLGLVGYNEVLSIDESTGLARSLGHFGGGDRPLLRGDYLYARRFGDPSGIMRLRYAPPGLPEYVAFTAYPVDLAVSAAGVFWPQEGRIRAVLGP